MTQRFADRFQGSKRSFGVFYPSPHPTDPGKKNAWTEKREITLADWEGHLAGRRGVGVTPANDAGVCAFGCIDIDMQVDHVRLIGDIKTHGLPLVVCTSNTPGRAHCYLFLALPLLASIVRNTLKTWANILGYVGKGVEIFPKQDIVGSDSFGNWINLPYYGGDNSTRYAVKPDGSRYTLEEFLDIPPHAGVLPNSSEDRTGIPPCVNRFLNYGVGEGGRDIALFNIGVYLKRSDELGWMDRLRNCNAWYMDPPLPSREVEKIVKSLLKKDYGGYQCEEHPLVDYCNKEVCLTQKYGIKAVHPNAGNFDNAEIGDLTKILAEPPVYRLRVNDTLVQLSAKQIMFFRELKLAVFEQANIVMPGMKQTEWEQIVQQKLQTRKDVGIPKDATLTGQIIEHLQRYLARRKQSDDKEALLTDGIVTVEQDIWFRGPAFIEYLRLKKVYGASDKLVWIALADYGCQNKKNIKVKGKNITVWILPLSLVNEQSEEFTVTEMGGELA